MRLYEVSQSRKLPLIEITPIKRRSTTLASHLRLVISGVLIVLGVFAASAPVSAGETRLVTPTFIADSGEEAWCQILNLGKKDITVTLDLSFFDGALIQSSGAKTVARGTTVVLVRSGDGTRLYCSFTGKFSKKDVRAAGEVYKLNGGSALVVRAE
jgi:hypothetical protein